MKVFVIGGTGFLGTHLLPKLLKHNHEVTVLTRRQTEASRLETLGIKAVIGDLLEPEPLMARLTPQDAVIFIAMPKVKPGRITRKQFRALRRQTTTYVSSAIAIAEKANCPLILTQGANFHTTEGEVADETWPIERFGMARIGEQVDLLISEAVKKGSPPLIFMLPGQIYGPGGLFKTMYDWMKEGKFRVIGSGKNYIPRIHVEDCAEAYIKALEKMPIGERFIIADDEPCTAREFADFLADRLNVPKPGSVPKFVIRLVLGKLLYETVTMNCRVSNAKAKRLLDLELQYPTYREGLAALVAGDLR